ncbi:hypothetical protein FRB96_007532 [Tulasnella sp. 330]|nr:hypothetical protein FRB96_007532 [Tulasnella sp. 330]KAG8879848.1 hypothetical protein FRB97_001325 [Tulasnella sp. 331]KAG8889595.1 hypothetical protein FRB98_003657 [Tulasnella sp. 332]
MRFVAALVLLAAIGIVIISALPLSRSTIFDKPNCTKDWTNGCIAAVVAGSAGGAAVVGGATGLTVHAVKKAREKKAPLTDPGDFEGAFDRVRWSTDPPPAFVVHEPDGVDLAWERLAQAARDIRWK